MSDKKLLTVAEVAEILSCSRMHVYRLINSGTLPAMNISVMQAAPTHRIDSDDLQEFLEASREPIR